MGCVKLNADGHKRTKRTVSDRFRAAAAHPDPVDRRLRVFYGGAGLDDDRGGDPGDGKSLGETPLRLSLVITAYLLSLAVFIPVSGWIADRFGARRVFCAAVLRAFATIYGES